VLLFLHLVYLIYCVGLCLHFHITVPIFCIQVPTCWQKLLCTVQTYFCSALSSKLRQLRLKRKQDMACSDGSSATDKKVVRRKPKKTAVATQQIRQPMSDADFNGHVTELKVFIEFVCFQINLSSTFLLSKQSRSWGIFIGAADYLQWM